MIHSPRTGRRRPPAAPQRTSRSSPRGADALALGAVLVAGIGLRLWLAARTSGLTMDSPLYVSMADTIGRAGGPIGPAHHGYPALVALAGLLLPGRELPGRAVSLFAGVALIAITFALARRALPRWAAATAAALVALHPLLAVFSGALMTEATFQAVA